MSPPLFSQDRQKIKSALQVPPFLSEKSVTGGLRMKSTICKNWIAYMLVNKDEVIYSDSEYIYDYTYFWQLVAVQ